MRVLELFSGTGSVRKVVLERHPDAEVVSLDIDPAAQATHTCSILDWDFRQYAPGYFNIVWASPPCTQYSCVRTTGPPRDLAGADAIVLRTLEIIWYFAPELYIIENPDSGLLKGREVVAGLPSVVADYCQYGWPYRKRTRFWTNRRGFVGKLCDRKTCDQIVRDENGVHHRRTFGGKNWGGRVSLAERHSIPPRLLKELLF